MKWTVNKLSEAKQIQVELADSGVKILMEPKRYACVECTSEKYPCEENSVYQIVSDIPTEDRKCKLIANWYQGETVIARRYINGKGETVSPKGVDRFSVSVLVNGKEPQELYFSKFSYEKVSDYKPNPVKLAAVSLDEGFLKEHPAMSKACFLGEYERLIDAAGKEKPDLILLPEEFHVQNFHCPAKERCISLEDEAVELMKRKAVEYHCYMAGTIQRNTDGYCYNTALLIDRQGNLVGTYDKTHLTLMEYEQGVTPGQEIPVFETDFGKVGFMICWDMWFPCLSQILYRKGAQLILNPTLGGGFLQAYAASASTGAFMLVSNAYDSRWSRVQNPLGDVIAQVKEGHILVETIDLNEMHFKSMLSVGADGEGRNLYITEARNDLYKEFFADYEVNTY